jgi:hypothetical protein
MFLKASLLTDTLRDYVIRVMEISALLSLLLYLFLGCTQPRDYH